VFDIQENENDLKCLPGYHLTSHILKDFKGRAFFFLNLQSSRSRCTLMLVGEHKFDQFSINTNKHNTKEIDTYEECTKQV
jgi:hypothetical protein